MGQSLSTTRECVDRQSIEYQIFDKSFSLIEKYIKNDTKGLRDAYNREYEWVLINEGDGDLNWHKVMPKHMTGCLGLPYAHAIQIVSSMVKVAEELSSQSDDRFVDKQKFRDIYRSVDQLCNLLDKQKSGHKSGCFCWTVGLTGDDYNEQFIMTAWDEFRRDHD